MANYLIKQATLVNEGKQFISDVLILNGRIEKIANSITNTANVEEINAEGLFLIPGCIDDQVHFREPGLTHKATIYSESRAAVAGGITSFMEMPNTVPSAVTIEKLEEKYAVAEKTSLANYSFYLGTTNSNIEEIKRINPLEICGVKIFMGSSTGDMLVDDPKALEAVFEHSPTIITTHCEDDPMIKQNFQRYIEEFGETIPPKFHPLIRNEEACYKSSSYAVSLAKKYNSRLHILHISSEKELELFSNQIPLKEKRITAEACVHHLWFSDEDYERLGNFIKWNPAIKKMSDRDAIMHAVNTNVIDVIATDHAPHTLEEKSQAYLKAPSGGPLVQYALLAMFEKVKEGKITIEKMVEKMCHAPAELFQIKDRGFIREGYFADLVLVNPSKSTSVTRDSILSLCKWSPFEGYVFSNEIESTFVNGTIVYTKNKIKDHQMGSRLVFDRR
ncbi:MAG: dihydroorotase [Crocinitomicaceae bacterium]|nr:dihydroorotase [Crocinitomicaceae bacterium]MCF8444733.1 dihydroorotase [Crocinitomicaceae bacterium]